jgi:hypothetical protein
MISNRSDQTVTPFLVRFAQELTPTPPAQADPNDEASTPGVTCAETRFTKVAGETTDDA